MKYIFFLCCFLLFNNSALAKNKGYKLEKEIEIIDSLKYQLSHRECISRSTRFLKKHPSNSYVNNILCYEFNAIRKWDSCIIVGVQFNKTYNYPLLNYTSIYEAYIAKRDLKAAIEISELAIKKQKNTRDAIKNLKEVKFDLFFSRTVSVFCSFILIFLFIYFHKFKMTEIKKNKINFIQLIFSAIAVNFFIYLLFYSFSEYIWSQNILLDPSVFTHLVKYEIYDKDGIEAFVLYLISFLSILLTMLIFKIKLLRNNKSSFITFISLLISIFSIYSIGFFPPLFDVGTIVQVLIVLFFVLVLYFVLDYFQNRSLKIEYFIILTLLFLICFRPIGEISILDNSIILFPALEMLSNHPISEIYFQYDMFLSLIVFVFLKFNLNLDFIQIPFQFSYFLFFIGVYVFSNRFFYLKKISIFCFLIILIVKLYSYSKDPTYAFGQTPLRLDLWIIPLILSIYLGIRHWSVAFTLGLMLLFHKNLGIIYVASYVQLLILLFLIDIDLKEFKLSFLIKDVKSHLRMNRMILLILALSLMFIFIMFGGFIPESAIKFSRLGINFLKISTDSLYWFLFPLYSIVFILLLKNKNILGKEYLASAFFIIFLSIGNSMYYFGRSHESGFVQILPLAILVFFILIDLSFKNKVISLSKVKIISVSMLVLITFIYSKNIFTKSNQQLDNFKNGRLFYTISSQPTKNDFDQIKILTNYSNKVAFLFCGAKRSKDDILYYLKGGYQLHNGKPLILEVFAKDQKNRLEYLLDQGYYVVTSTPYYLNTVIPFIERIENKTLGRYTAYYKP